MGHCIYQHEEDALQRSLISAVEKVNRPYMQEFVRSILAGMYIGFGCIFMLIVKSDGLLAPAISSLLSGLVFSLGLFSVFIGFGELFTGNCMLFTGVISDVISTKEMLRTWAINVLGNFLGILFIVTLIRWSSLITTTAAHLAYTKFSKGIGILIISGILCNLLVCLSVIMNYSAKSVTDKFIAAVMPVTLFVAAGFEHSIADIFFAFLTQGLVSIDTILIAMAAIFFGNILGGLFMAVYFNYACTSKFIGI